MKALLSAIAAILLTAAAASAQTGIADAPTFAINEKYARVAPAQGPAWWKVSRGDSVVWILGAPPTRAQGRPAWDDKTYRRRVNSARLIIVPYGEQSGLPVSEYWPPLSTAQAQDVGTALARLDARPGWGKVATFGDALRLRGLYISRNGLLARANEDIVEDAERARAPLMRVPIPQITWQAGSFRTGDPQIPVCTEALLAFVRTDPKAFNRAHAYWAAGDVPNMLAAAPRDVSHVCRRYWAGHRDETIAFQAAAVMEALRRPGSTVAIYPVDHIVAQDGILARLEAKGYTIADPSQPLSED